VKAQQNKNESEVQKKRQEEECRITMNK